MAITPLPSAPLISDDPATFNTKAFAFVGALNPMVTEINAELPAIDAAGDAGAAAVAAANFKGEWSTLTGALAIPASVSHNGSVWVLTQSLADVTSNEPGVDSPNYWLAVSLPAAGASGNVLTSDGTNWTSSAPPSNYPQNIQTANYTLVLSDAGKQIYHPASDVNVRTFTIPSNASVAFPIGTVVLFVAENGGTNIKVAINSDTLVTTEGITGAKLVPPSNVLTCIKTTATKWICYLANDIFSPAEQIAVAHVSSPYIAAYIWLGSGFGTKFTNPATLPTGDGYGVAFSPDGDNIAVAHSTSPFITAYPWSNSGFGTKYTNPATLPASNADSVAFSPSGNDIAVAHLLTPFIAAYPWSGSGFGTKFTNPATLPAGNGRGVSFSPDGANIAVAHTTTPFITAYPWSGSGFGTKYANPATLPAGTGNGVAFSPDGSAIAVAHNTTPFITAYPWSGSGFGTKFTNPATLPAGNGRGVSFSPDGANIAVAHTTTPFITAYPWSGSGFGTKYANPATLPASDGYGVAFGPSGADIAVAHETSPFITAYTWSGSGFGTKFTNPDTLPAQVGNSVAFNSF